AARPSTAPRRPFAERRCRAASRHARLAPGAQRVLTASPGLAETRGLPIAHPAHQSLHPGPTPMSGPPDLSALRLRPAPAPRRGVPAGLRAARGRGGGAAAGLVAVRLPRGTPGASVGVGEAEARGAGAASRAAINPPGHLLPLVNPGVALGGR